LKNQVKNVELGCIDEKLIWKITDVSAKTRQGKDSVITSFYSPNFMTSKYGDKMCARLYFNGDGMGKRNNVSLFLILLCGDYDALQWPFRQKVTLTLIDQVCGQHHQDAFRPNMSSSSFARPLTAMNVASNYPLFITHRSVLDQHGNPYVVNDTLFIKIEVATRPSPLYI
jgi:TNF receptor-associated factor 2